MFLIEHGDFARTVDDRRAIALSVLARGLHLRDTGRVLFLSQVFVREFMMSVKPLILSVLLLGFSANAIAEPSLAGTWSMKLAPGGSAPRGARTLPKSIDIKQSGDRIDVTAFDFGNEKMLYACSLKSECVGLPGWWVRWDGAELVLETRSAGEPSRTLYRFYLSPDGQNLLLRAQDDPQAIAFPYSK